MDCIYHFDAHFDSNHSRELEVRLLWHIDIFVYHFDAYFDSNRSRELEVSLFCHMDNFIY